MAQRATTLLVLVFGFIVNTGLCDDETEYRENIRAILQNSTWQDAIISENQNIDENQIKESIEAGFLKEVMEAFGEIKDLYSTKAVQMISDGTFDSITEKLKKEKNERIDNVKRDVASIVTQIKSDNDILLTDKLKEYENKIQNMTTSLKEKVTEDVDNLRKKNLWQNAGGNGEPVAFTALLSSNTQHDGVIVFNHVVSNFGKGYNNKNGAFRAPEEGTYMFMISFLVDDGYVNINLQRNGQEVVRGYAAKQTFEGSGYVQAIIELSKGDNMTVGIIKDYNTGFLRADYYTSYSGFKIQ